MKLSVFYYKFLGLLVCVFVKKEIRIKLELKSVLKKFFGYSLMSKGFRFWNLMKDIVIESFYVKFNELFGLYEDKFFCVSVLIKFV